MSHHTAPQPFWAGTPARTSRRGHFWIPGERVTGDQGTYQRGPMFVAWEAPEEVTQPYPVVLVHGGTLQGTEWLDTPDGRPGWAQRLVEAGYAVLVVDRPGHGRSPYHGDIIGPMGPPFSYEESGASSSRPRPPKRRPSGLSIRPMTTPGMPSSPRSGHCPPTFPPRRRWTPTGSPASWTGSVPPS